MTYSASLVAWVGGMKLRYQTFVLLQLHTYNLDIINRIYTGTINMVGFVPSKDRAIIVKAAFLFFLFSFLFIVYILIQPVGL